MYLTKSNFTDTCTSQNPTLRTHTHYKIQLVKQLSDFLAHEDETKTLLDFAGQPIGPVGPALKDQAILVLLEP